MFYDVFLKICEERGVAPTRVLLDLNMSKSAIKNWKEGGSPSNPTKRKLSDYFGITVTELMSGEIEQKEITPDLTEEDERDIARMLSGMLGQMDNSNSDLMFDGEPVDEETKELLKISLENQFRLAKQLMQQRKNKDKA